MSNKLHQLNLTERELESVVDALDAVVDDGWQQLNDEPTNLQVAKAYATDLSAYQKAKQLYNEIAAVTVEGFKKG